MSNLFRRASDALRHHQHQRKDSEDSVNQETVVSPSQEPQEHVDQVEPQPPLMSPSPQEQKAETAPGLESSGNDKAKAEKETPHHHRWGFFRRPSEAEREKRRLSQQEKERADWDASKKDDTARQSSQGAGVEQ